MGQRLGGGQAAQVRAAAGSYSVTKDAARAKVRLKGKRRASWRGWSAKKRQALERGCNTLPSRAQAGLSTLAAMLSSPASSERRASATYQARITLRPALVSMRVT